MINRKKHIHFISLGCPKNLVDSEVMLGISIKLGFGITAYPEEAKVIIINTCAFIDSAKEESIQTILEMAEFRKAGSCEKLIVTGCLSQRYIDDLLTELPEVDHYIGTGNILDLEMVLSGKKQEKQIVGEPGFLLEASTPRQLATPDYSAFVKISEGCSSSCAFCIIPTLRGKMRSRSIDDITSEIKHLLANGVKELNLIGQDVSAYGQDLKDGTNLIKLLRTPEISTGSHWLRLHYLYPKRVDIELLKAIKDGQAILPYIDMPIQHIDSTILKAMRRGDNEASTKQVVDNIHKILPDAVLRTTLIVGFPGETEEMFASLLDYVKEGHFDRLGAFAYSPQEGTKAVEYQDVISEEVKQERLDLIMEAQRDISAQKLENLVGKTLDVIVEGVSEESELLLAGRYWGQGVDIDGVMYLVDGDGKAGDIKQVEITEAHDYDLVGRIL